MCVRKDDHRKIYTFTNSPFSSFRVMNARSHWPVKSAILLKSVLHCAAERSGGITQPHTYKYFFEAILVRTE
jgi:hypothetical protein